MFSTRLLRTTMRSTAVFVGLFFVGQTLLAATSASVNGTVTDAEGNPVADATVTILHATSGTTATAVSGANGTFYQSGLRVGGPYTFSVKAEGFTDAEIPNINLQPGLQTAPSIVLRGEYEDAEDLVVTAVRPGQATLLNNGIGSSYSSEDIANQPSGERDAIKTLLRDPLAHSEGEGNLSVAGVNPRFNGLAIDGSLQQDDFGLSRNTYATERSPINLDAIESVSLVASDYSVQASGFTGGLVNITTKSGGNEWDGSVFYYFQNEGHIGDTYAGDRSYSAGAFNEIEAGFTIGGPIIQDELFIFFSLDEFESSESVDFGQYDSNNGVMPGFFEAFRNVIRDTYGWDPGGRPAVSSTPVSSERTLVKVDWNANEFHRVSLTHQITKEMSTSVGAARFESNWIDLPVDLDSTTIQLFSDWTDQLSSTARINRKTFMRGQNCRAGPGVGAMEIDNIDGDDLRGTPLEGLLTGSVDLDAGCDRFRHANAYNDERLQVLVAIDYVLGSNIVQFGAEVEAFDLFNLFVPGSAGRFLFNGYDGLVDRIARVDYVNTVTNNAADGAAEWGFGKQTLFVQNNWEPMPNLEMSLGARFERFTQSDSPVASRELMLNYGIDSSANIDGRSLFLPRMSFRYVGFDDTIVSGGLGLFAGGDPKVWTSNVFQVPTVFTRAYGARDVDPTRIPQTLLDQVAATPEGTPIDVLAEDFEIPSDWKLSLRMDRTLDLSGLKLGDGYSFVVQYLHTQTNNGFQWRNLAQTDLPAALPTGTAPDGRVIYADLDRLGLLNLTQLRNFSGGNSQIVTFSLAKSFDFGLDASASYAWQNVEMVTEGVSSRGISNWRNIQDVDRNNPSARDSPHEVEHAYKFNFGYERGLGAGIIARADVFGRVNTGYRYTVTFDTHWSNALFGRAGAGESPYDNTPLYIPTDENDPRVVYSRNFDKEGFFNWIAENGFPSGIHEPYSEYADWNAIWDLRLQLTIPGLSAFNQYVGENTVKVILDIDNVLNLLNDEWGVFEYGPRYNQLNVVRSDLISVADMERRGVDGASALTGDSPRTTCQSATDCVYRFTRFRDYSIQFPNGPRSVYKIRFGIRIDL